MTCASSIVECLREKNIEPLAFAYSPFSSSYLPKNALYYTASNHYSSVRENKQQWWSVDFTKIISFHSYSIKTEASGCSWITKWTLLVSKNNRTWTPVDSPPLGVPGDKIFPLNKTVNARFVRLDGSSIGCGSIQNAAFAFYYIKFFGSTMPIKEANGSCRSKNKINTNLLRMIIMISS